MQFPGRKNRKPFCRFSGRPFARFPIRGTFVAVAHLSGGHDDPLGAVVWPWGSAGVLATTFKIGTGLYFIVMAMISSAIGGYIAGGLRTKWTGVHSDEVYFRDTAHGFLAWAFASVLGAVLLASPASSLVGGAASGATQAAAGSVQSSGPMDGYVDTLLRSDTAQASANPQYSRGELVRLFTTSFRNGNDLAPADRTYVALWLT